MTSEINSRQNSIKINMGRCKDLHKIYKSLVDKITNNVVTRYLNMQ